MTVKEIELPQYSLGEELVNSISHGVGALLGIVGLVFALLKVCPTGDPVAITSICVYGVSMILMFGMSCIYHAMGRNNGKRVLRVMDHNTVFIMIAGTYTPYTLIALRSSNVFGWGVGTVGYIIFAVVWIATILGIIFNSIDIKKYQKFCNICYLAIGWCIIFAFIPLWSILTPAGACLLLGGGLSYTVGAILYGIGHSKKYFHSVFHFLVLLGVILMYFSIYLYVI